MSKFVSGFINDLSAVKDNVTLRVRILCAWMQPLFSKPHVTNMEMIVIDEQVSPIVLYYMVVEESSYWNVS